MSTHRAFTTSLFPTLSKSRQLLLHFRFVSQAFISSLSGYIFNTAIEGNFGPLIARLTTTESSTSLLTNTPEQSFSDVFELAQAHSNLLDDILSACLLRSGQKGVGELLRQSMELVLEFTIVIGELHRGRIEEYQAAPMVEELYGRFSIKMTTLVSKCIFITRAAKILLAFQQTRVLKGLVEKNPSSSNPPLETFTSRRQAIGGLDALYHLLIRLDLTDWWSTRRFKIEGK